MQLKRYVRVVGYALATAMVAFAIYVQAATSAQQDIDARIFKMYAKLQAQAGVGGLPPLFIVESPILNAYTDGNKVVIYRGLIDFADNDDEIALVLGHELAHNTLYHLRMNNLAIDEQVVIEAQADKMGAVYMMKAGYDICKGRMMWMKFYKEDGDYLGGSHPGYAYRFSQLNVNCGGEL
jgi:predicted Zn-dependent protease